MIESIGDYENWRDSQHDRPKPEPDEHQYRFYSHDYTADTTLEYTRQGDHAELMLSFGSEDPDMGVEEMVYGGENHESMAELVSDLKREITAYLDAADTASFYDQQGMPVEIDEVYDKDAQREYARQLAQKEPEKQQKTKQQNKKKEMER